MKSMNREARALKRRYDERRAKINLDYSTRQVQLSHSIDMARNRVHYLSQTMRQPGADVEAIKTALDKAVDRLHEFDVEKVNMEYERKNAIVALDRQRDADIAALEQKYSVNIGEKGGEL